MSGWNIYASSEEFQNNRDSKVDMRAAWQASREEAEKEIKQLKQIIRDQWTMYQTMNGEVGWIYIQWEQKYSEELAKIRGEK
jgi:hypothetical protein